MHRGACRATEFCGVLSEHTTRESNAAWQMKSGRAGPVFCGECNMEERDCFVLGRDAQMGGTEGLRM
jgi:hypothetical protein